MIEEIIKDYGSKYILYQEHNPDQLRLEFSFPRGGFAEDYATMILSQEENALFRNEGKSYIDNLVVKIIRQTELYEGRVKIL